MINDKNTQRRPYISAGIIMIISIAVIMASQIYLGAVFDWEDKPFREVFEMYRLGLPWIRIFWFTFAIGSMLLIPISLLLNSCFKTGKDELLRIGTCFGIIAGFSYVIGIMRWVLLADALSFQSFYLDGTGSLSTDLFGAFNVYAGNSFGETIAPLSHAAMIICIGISILKNNIGAGRITRLFALLQIPAGIGIALRPLEYAGLKALGRASDMILILWAIIFLAYGIYLICAGKSVQAEVNNNL